MQLAVPPGDRRAPSPEGARAGVWIGCFGWLIGFLAVGFDFVPELWPQLLGGAAVTAIVAFAVGRVALASKRPPFGLLLSAMLTAIGILLLYYALAMMPAVRELPELVERLESLSSVVEVPIWLGATLVAAGIAGLILCRRAAPA